MTAAPATRLTLAATGAFWVTLLACVGGLLTSWATGFLNPERGSAVGEALFLTLSPALVLTAVVWVLARRVPAASATTRLALLGAGWVLFLVTTIA